MEVLTLKMIGLICLGPCRRGMQNEILASHFEVHLNLMCWIEFKLNLSAFETHYSFNFGYHQLFTSQDSLGQEPVHLNALEPSGPLWAFPVQYLTGLL